MYKVKGTLSVLSGRKYLKGVTHKSNPIAKLTLAMDVSVNNVYFSTLHILYVATFLLILCCDNAPGTKNTL